MHVKTKLKSFESHSFQLTPHQSPTDNLNTSVPVHTVCCPSAAFVLLQQNCHVKHFLPQLVINWHATHFSHRLLTVTSHTFWKPQQALLILIEIFIYNFQYILPGSVCSTGLELGQWQNFMNTVTILKFTTRTDNSFELLGK